MQAGGGAGGLALGERLEGNQVPAARDGVAEVVGQRRVDRAAPTLLLLEVVAEDGLVRDDVQVRIIQQQARLPSPGFGAEQCLVCCAVAAALTPAQELAILQR